MGDKARILGISGGAVGIGGFSAALGLCCGAPWIVGILGVTGAIAFARLEFLLPYALFAAAALLGIGFYLAYHVQPVCEDRSCIPESSRALRKIVWIAAMLVSALAIIAVAGRT
jgi:hypothetical protein